MTAVDLRIEPLLARLEADPTTPNGVVDDIRQAVSESPFLCNLLAKAVEDKRITDLHVSTDKRTGGYFDDKTKVLNINAAAFSGNQSRSESLDYITEVLGHETMHGVISADRLAAQKAFDADIAERMKSAVENREPSVNFTEPTRTYLDHTRTDEALAETAGLRSLASRVRHQAPSSSSSDVESELVARSSSKCIDRNSGENALAKGLHIDEFDRSTSPFKRNDATTKAVEACFYDQGGRLGEKQDSDYRNYNGMYPLASIAHEEDVWSGRASKYIRETRTPEIQLDLKALGLDPRQLERNGVDLGITGKLRLTDATGYGMVSMQSSGKNTVSPQRDDAAQGPSNPQHPDHGMYRQIRTGVEALDQQQGRSFDQTSDRITHSLLTAAKGSGFERVDHVVMGRPPEQPGQVQNIFAVQGGLRDLTMMRAHVDSDVAARTPVQQSVAQLHTVNQQLAAEKSQQQTADISRTQEQVQKPMQHSL